MGSSRCRGGCIPRLLRGDKENILGFDPAVPNTKLFDTALGLPLYWGERKHSDLWARIMTDLDVKYVYDLSPGSGPLARACLDKGIVYAGFARNEAHPAWLSNLLDRYAMRAILTKGNAMFAEDLAETVKDHFQDIVDNIDELERSADTELEEGTPLS